MNRDQKNKDYRITPHVGSNSDTSGATGDYIQLIGGIVSVIGESIQTYGQGVSIKEDQQEQCQQELQQKKVGQEIDQLKKEIKHINDKQQQQTDLLLELVRHMKEK